MSTELTPAPSTTPPNSRWDGTRWVTLDGRYWWDGRQWQPFTAVMAPAPPPPYAPSPIPGWSPDSNPHQFPYGGYPYPRKQGKGGLYALSVGLFLLAFPCLIFPPLGILVWVLSVITLIVAIAK